tara:strand:- start:160 stop:309 length:150 start_codon:yes stop_codon:yes gene_type:complete
MNYSTSKQTEQRRLKELVVDVTNHPHRDELIDIMYQQMVDEQDICSVNT